MNKTPARRPSSKREPTRAVASRSGTLRIVEELADIEANDGEGTLDVAPGKALHVSSLDKRYFPEDGITKGDVMRYYASVAPLILPVIRDRPLILKRYPDGIAGPAFFQQNAGPHTPDLVRTASVATAAGAKAERIIGGDLATLLYTVQIGTIAVHAWQARVQSAQFADSTTIDLDPGDDVPFSKVVLLARGIKAELDRLGLSGALKTSGSSGLHLVLPLPPRTPFETGARLAEVIAERMVQTQPDLATTERSIKARPAGTIYVDALQNAEGKSVVAAYSVRERSGATVSAPLDWRELRSTLRLQAFTVKTMPARIKKVGDLWGNAMKRRNTKRVIDRALRDA